MGIGEGGLGIPQPARVHLSGGQAPGHSQAAGQWRRGPPTGPALTVTEPKLCSRLELWLRVGDVPWITRRKWPQMQRSISWGERQSPCYFPRDSLWGQQRKQSGDTRKLGWTGICLGRAHRPHETGGSQAIK